MGGIVSIETVFFGTLSLEELEKFYTRKSKAKYDLNINWQTDISKIISKKINSNFEDLGDQDREFIFNIEELGYISLEQEEPRAIKLYGFIEHGIIPSFQIRIRTTFEGAHDHATLEDAFGILMDQIRTAKTMLSKEGLIIKDCVSMINVSENYSQSITRVMEVAVSSIGEPHSASVIGNTVLLKIISESFNYFIILNPQNTQLMINLYFLRIAKEKIKVLIGSIKLFRSKELADLKNSIDYYNVLSKSKKFSVEKFLLTRESALKRLNYLRQIKRERELLLMFIESHLDTFFSTQEGFADKSKNRVIKSEKDELRFYYLNPLENLISDSERDLMEIRDHLTELSEIYSILTNIHLQKVIIIFTVILSALTAVSLISAFLHI